MHAVARESQGTGLCLLLTASGFVSMSAPVSAFMSASESLSLSLSLYICVFAHCRFSAYLLQTNLQATVQLVVQLGSGAKLLYDCNNSTRMALVRSVTAKPE